MRALSLSTFCMVGLLLLEQTAQAQAQSNTQEELEALSSFLLDEYHKKNPPLTQQSRGVSLLSVVNSSETNGRLASELALSRMEVTPHITPETTELFGERIDLNTGAVKFEHVDISLRGNNGLPVEIRRSYWGSKNNFANNLHFGDWTLELPSITTTTLAYDLRTPIPRQGLSHIPNCQGDITPYWVDTQFATVAAASYWSGDTLNIPGQTNQKLREIDGVDSDRAADNWKVSCIDGQFGFLVTSPEGVKYTLDVMSLVPASFIRVDQEGLEWNPDYPASVLMQTYTLNIQVSRIEDRFGNWVDFTYEGTTTPIPGFFYSATYGENLTRIESSDGRLIELTYEAGQQSDRISSIVADGKTYTYDYDVEFDSVEQVSKDVLDVVTRPDGKMWQFDLTYADYGGYSAGAGWRNDCQVLTGGTLQSSMTHPNGAVLELTHQAKQFGVSQILDEDNRCFSALSVVQKQLNFNGEQLTWNYSYSQNAGAPKYSPLNTPAPAAVSGLPYTPTGYDLMDLRSTSVVAPDGSKAVHVFNRSKTELEGQAVATFFYDTNGTTLLRSLVKEYTTPRKLGSVGFKMCKPSTYPVDRREQCITAKTFGNPKTHNYHQYLATQTVRTHDGGAVSTYTTHYDDYNAYGKPLRVHEQSVQGSRYTRTTYQHDTQLWVLNLPTKTERSSNGTQWTEVSRQNYYYGYTSMSLLPFQSHSYGVLQRTQTHHSNGLLKRESWNVANRFVEFNNYVRGIPTSITLPQRYGSGVVSASQTVNARGEVTAVTNFKGATTQYSYDVLGRVTSITPPSPWLATTISYTDENGYLVQTQTRGNYQKRIEHDALLRPVLTREQDINTQIKRYVRQRFDAYNQPTFVSYPSRTTSLSAGHTTSYDGLQRVRQVRNTVTQQGPSYTYLSGNRVRETNARGYSTTTTYRSFGVPEQKLATLISAPEGVTTTLSYNLFDQPVSISQGGSTEYRRYDTQQRLCKVVRADVGATAYYYNAVGDLLWEAPGANGSTASCDASSVYSTRKISYIYDNVGNVRQQSFPDATPTRQYTFDAQGQLTQLTAGNAVWSYWYNTLGLLESEQLSIDGLQFLTDYGYNTAGHRVSTIYPSGRVVGYAPNAYGEPTQAGSYATNASYYANGIVRGYDTPNGLTLWQTLDSQQRLKKREVHGGGNHVVELSYTYDANHNIQSIIDGVNGTHSVTGLSYDGLDRLVAATGHWGQGSYSYDSNGNIVTRQLGSASDTYHYDSAKRLTHISGSTARNFSYDNRGNVISNGQRSFSFNRAGQISGSGGISYRYDGHGRRVAKTVSGSTTYSYYSQDGQLLGTYADGDYTDYYYLGREMVARYSDSTQSDAPGYTGHVEDDDLGLVYMQQRYYDANIGRFYSNDPVDALGHIQRGNAIHGVARYTYVNNNPYRYTDPDGRAHIEQIEAAIMDSALIETNGDYGAANDIKNSTLDGMGNAALSASGVTDGIEALQSLSDGDLIGGAIAVISVVCKPCKAVTMQRKLERGQIPKKSQIDRFDSADPNQPGSKDHVHFRDGSSMNNDGTPHDKHKGTPNPNKAARKALEENNWAEKPKGME